MIKFSNYWMRLVWVRYEEWVWMSVNEWGVCYPPRPSASVDITLLDLHNSSYPTKAEFNNCFIIHSKYFPVLKGVPLFVFLLTNDNTILSPGFFGQWFNNLQQAALWMSFWHHRFNNLQRAALLTSLIQYDEDSFQIWWTAAGYGELCVWFHNQKEGKSRFIIQI